MDTKFSAKPTSAFSWLILLGVVANVLLAMGYHLTGIGFFSTAQNASGAVVVAVITLALMVRYKATGRGAVSITAWVSIFAIHTLLNAGQLDFSDWLKVLSIFVLYLAGSSLNFRYGPKEKRLIYILMGLPIVLIGGSRVYPTNFASFSIFENYNTAILYYMAILFAAAPAFGRYSIYIHFSIVLIFQKIGILLATVIGLTAPGLGRLRSQSILIVGAMSVVLALAYFLGLLERALSVGTMLVSDLSTLGFSGLAQMSFASIYERTQSTDLSGYFRLLHWSNILALYVEGGLPQMLFGVGGGVTPRVTAMGLVPHNDYIKILFEYGLLFFLFFVLFLVSICRRINNPEQKAIFFILIVYFFSENILNNFSSMAIFFFFAGLAVRTTSQQASANHQQALDDVTRRAAKISQPSVANSELG